MIPISNHKVLIAALNWGKGHVARSIGLIHELLRNENDVTVAGSHNQLAIFKHYFPNINYCLIDDYPFSFSGHGNFGVDLWNSRTRLREALRLEHRWVENFVSINKIDVVVADHRYGFYSEKVNSIFVTHQLNLALRWWQSPAQWLHHRLIKKFNEIWVLDTDDSALAGKLSQQRNVENVRYIGHFSRFMFAEQHPTNPLQELVICNGPHPYDEQLLLNYLDDANKMIIAPAQLCKKHERPNLLPSDDWLKCDQLILSAEKIYAYCGYSTLMDLKFLNCEAELFPTKGQSEQEYLAELHGFRERKS